jgi:hypothetical protein
MLRPKKRGLALIAAVVAVSVCASGFALNAFAEENPYGLSAFGFAKASSLELSAPEVLESSVVPFTQTGVEATEADADTSGDISVNIGSGLLRATGNIDWDIPAYSTATSTDSMSMEAGESITINVSYSPSSASIRVGILEPDGTFRYVTGSAGSVNHTFSISTRGQYKVRIQNLSSNLVTVIGFVNY